MTTDTITITLDGEPVPKARPRFGRGRVYTPARTKKFETDLAWMAKREMIGRKPLAGALKVEIVFAMTRPEFVDVDNLTKAALDACNGVVWRDDSQVVELVARKSCSDKAQTWIRVSPVLKFPWELSA